MLLLYAIKSLQLGIASDFFAPPLCQVFRSSDWGTDGRAAWLDMCSLITKGFG